MSAERRDGSAHRCRRRYRRGKCRLLPADPVGRALPEAGEAADVAGHGRVGLHLPTRQRGRWFSGDAEDAREWLVRHGLIDAGRRSHLCLPLRRSPTRRTALAGPGGAARRGLLTGIVPRRQRAGRLRRITGASPMCPTEGCSSRNSTCTCRMASCPAPRWSSGTAAAGSSATSPTIASWARHWRGWVVSASWPTIATIPPCNMAGFMEDAARAALFAADHARTYGLDAERLVLMGHSAGAHMAALLALDTRYLAAAAACPAASAGVIGLSGPYDFLPLHEDDVQDMFGPPRTYPANRNPSSLPGGCATRVAGTRPRRRHRVAKKFPQSGLGAARSWRCGATAPLPQNTHADTVAALSRRGVAGRQPSPTSGIHRHESSGSRRVPTAERHRRLSRQPGDRAARADRRHSPGRSARTGLVYACRIRRRWRSAQPAAHRRGRSDWPGSPSGRSLPA